MTKPNQLISGAQYLLDGKTIVTIIKPSTRSNSSYSIEIPGQSIEIVSADRLTSYTPEMIKPELQQV